MQTFKKTESPDFTFAQFFIECGSIHITRTTSTSDDFNNKIESVLRKKSIKRYCHSRTALFVDATNLLYYVSKNNISGSLSIDKKFLAELLNSYPFGSLVVWTFIINPEANKYQWK